MKCCDGVEGGGERGSSCSLNSEHNNCLLHIYIYIHMLIYMYVEETVISEDQWQSEVTLTLLYDGSVKYGRVHESRV